MTVGKALIDSKKDLIVRELDVNEKASLMAGEGVPATLPERSLRELINAQVVTGFAARGDKGGFVVEATLGSEPGRIAKLGNTRGGVRIFASLSTVAMLLQRLGFNEFVVNSSEYVPGRVRGARPDRSEALKNASSPKGESSAKPRKKKAT